MEDEIKLEDSIKSEQKPRLTLMEKLLAGFFLLVFLFVFYISLDANKYEAQVRVVEGEGHVGVNPTSERLDFGDLSRGTAAVRTVTINNNTPVPFFVVIWRLGSISGLMKLDMNHFLLRQNSEEKIEFTTYMPASAEIDHMYTGKVFVFKIPAPFL